MPIHGITQKGTITPIFKEGDKKTSVKLPTDNSPTPTQ